MTISFDVGQYTDFITSSYHVQNFWVVTGEPDLPDIDIDVADTIGDLISKKLAQAIKDTIPGDSTLEKSIVKTIENIGEFTRDFLDLPDDLQEWIQQIILDEFGLSNIIMGAILDYFKNKLTAKFQFEDPFEIMKKTKFRLCDYIEIALNPVKVPIDNFHVEVTDTNLVIKADVGSKKK